MLCGQDVEWFVQEIDGAYDLGTVAFTGASAGTFAGASVGPSGAKVVEIVQGGVDLTKVALSATGVVVSHV